MVAPIRNASDSNATADKNRRLAEGPQHESEVGCKVFHGSDTVTQPKDYRPSTRRRGVSKLTHAVLEYGRNAYLVISRAQQVTEHLQAHAL